MCSGTAALFLCLKAGIVVGAVVAVVWIVVAVVAAVVGGVVGGVKRAVVAYRATSAAKGRLRHDVWFISRRRLSTYAPFALRFSPCIKYRI